MVVSISVIALFSFVGISLACAFSCVLLEAFFPCRYARTFMYLTYMGATMSTLSVVIAFGLVFGFFPMGVQ